MNKAMQPKQFFFMLVAVIGALVVGIAAGYYYLSTNLKRQTVTLSERLADVEVADDAIAQLRLLEKQYQKAEPLVPALEASLPRTKQQTEILIQLQQLAARSGLSLPGITFASTAGLPTPVSQSIKEGDVLMLPVNFQTTGSYEQLSSFLQGLERFNRYTKVAGLNVTRVENRPKTLTFSVNLNVYFKP
jgi:Tfp pilus assembly protein PilO